MSQNFQISGKNLIRKLQKIGFQVIRVKGSHHRLKHSDGRITTIPVHRNRDLPKGLLRKIIYDDIKMSIEEIQRI